MGRRDDQEEGMNIIIVGFNLNLKKREREKEDFSNNKERERMIGTKLMAGKKISWREQKIKNGGKNQRVRTTARNALANNRNWLSNTLFKHIARKSIATYSKLLFSHRILHIRLIYLNRDIDYFSRDKNRTRQTVSEKGGVPSKLDFKFSAHSDKH